MIGELDIVTHGDFMLTTLDKIIGKLDHFATAQAYQVIMMMLGGEFKHGFAAFEVVTADYAASSNWFSTR